MLLRSRYIFEHHDLPFSGQEPEAWRDALCDLIRRDVEGG